MIGNWSMSKDELYGPPPAYSISTNYEHPPSYMPSIYVVPARSVNSRDRSSSHATIILTHRFTRYLLGTGLIHMVLGLAAIVCDIMLTIMNESFSFTGLWTGAPSIILGIYLIVFISRPEKRICSLQRLQCLHVVMGLISIVALILTSINLASDSCYKIFLGPDSCEHSSYFLKTVLIITFSFTFVQICTTIVLSLVQMKKSRLTMASNERATSEIMA